MWIWNLPTNEEKAVDKTKYWYDNTWWRQFLLTSLQWDQMWYLRKTSSFNEIVGNRHDNKMPSVSLVVISYVLSQREGFVHDNVVLRTQSSGINTQGLWDQYLIQYVKAVCRNLTTIQPMTFSLILNKETPKFYMSLHMVGLTNVKLC